MYLQHVVKLFKHPKLEWKAIKDEPYTTIQFCLTRLSILAGIPSLALLLGLSVVGWSFSGTEFHPLPFSSALLVSIVFFLSMIAGALAMAYFIFWLETTYSASASFVRCITFISHAALPMYLAGLIALLPIIWLLVLVIISAVFYSLYLLYIGIPIFMDIPEGKGFMFSTSIIMAGLCTLVGWVASIAVLWNAFFI